MKEEQNNNEWYSMYIEYRMNGTTGRYQHHIYIKYVSWLFTNCLFYLVKSQSKAVYSQCFVFCIFQYLTFYMTKTYADR